MKLIDIISDGGPVKNLIFSMNGLHNKNHSEHVRGRSDRSRREPTTAKRQKEVDSAGVEGRHIGSHQPLLILFFNIARQSPYKQSTPILRTVYDKRTLKNPVLNWTFRKKYPNLDPTLIDPSHEFDEAERELKKRHPDQMVVEPEKGDWLSVNNFILPADFRYSPHECLFCHRPFKAKRSTKKYCSNSHRVMDCRRRKRLARSYCDGI